jgi:hypothetical protein
MLWQPWGLLYYVAQMAEMHARLHALPIEAFPAPAGHPFHCEPVTP